MICSGPHSDPGGRSGSPDAGPRTMVGTPDAPGVLGSTRVAAALTSVTVTSSAPEWCAMSVTIRRFRTKPRSSSVAQALSTARQSIGWPSTTRAASASIAARSSLTGHLLVELEQRPADRHPRRIGGRLSGFQGDLLVAEAPFETHDD